MTGPQASAENDNVKCLIVIVNYERRKSSKIIIGRMRKLYCSIKIKD